jgi:DNA-binding beta-propeller fold protein YncE
MVYGTDECTFELVREWADLPDDESFLDASAVRVDENDTVHVLNRSERPLMLFERTGERLATRGESHFSRPHGMDLGPVGAIYCTDDGDHTVKVFSPSGELLMTLGTEDEPSDTGFRDANDFFERIASIRRGAGPFNRPTGVTVPDSGEIFVADGYGNARVHVFGPDGNLRRSWGDPGANPGEFRVPHSIHPDDDRIWVTDRENSRIQIFDAEGKFVTEWTDLIRPTDLAIDGDTVYVTELCKRLSVFTTDGELVTRWSNEGHPRDDPVFVAPHSVAVDSAGDLYVGEASDTYEGVDLGARTVRKFERLD